MAKATKIRQKQKFITVDGIKYQMAMDLNAMAELEEVYGSVDKGMEALERGSFKAIRDVLYASFRSYHPEMDLLDVGKLITMENMEELSDTLHESLKENAPEVDPN